MLVTDWLRGGGLVTLALVIGATVIQGCSRAASDTALSRLTDRAEEGNEAFIAGDMRRWIGLVGPIASDFTLMQPFGGVSHGFDASEERLDQLERMFTGGQARFELVETYGGRDLAVLVFIERQQVEVGGLSAQDWSLRVTQVYRRRGDVWELVHRHADPIVNNIGLQRTAALAEAD